MTSLPGSNIVIVGAGAIGTALAQALAHSGLHDIVLLSIEADVVDSINEQSVNHKYFPTLRLHPSLSATLDPAVLSLADVIFLAIPSTVTVEYVVKHLHYIPPTTILVNLAKGLASDDLTIAESLAAKVPMQVCSLKGPSFARELMNQMPTAFTLAATDRDLFDRFSLIFDQTPIFIDYSDDIRGVEILSILKNIYAIVIGIVDANFNSPNLRSLVLTKAFDEMRRVLLFFGGKSETMFNYCGIGDFTLTALNDLSRNRTLGLLIGKGFFNNEISDKVVLEGKIAVGVFVDLFREKAIPSEEYFMMNELYKVFHEPYKISSFVSKILAQ